YPRVDGKKKRDMNPSFVYRSEFREYGIGAQILRDLGVRKMRLITNNRKNLVGLSGYGLEVTANVPFPLELPYGKEAGKRQKRRLKA
ncbi:MAG: bifunctional 3,4-dihydroxy-2-butanone-4-phosphate synthase/GTP cyclohydrolase II, partial [Deltaproteobacteria bacterium]|nr:bifunctional 3,4-dihydroxy-2-butanone-4-phosphate synthase/GTP cyclohydrolase II [Deltaproteobacteria bacterium]